MIGWRSWVRGLAAVALFPSVVGAQADMPEPMSLNLLTAPAAPAFVLLGIEPASVERPGSVTDIAVSLRSATDDFSVLPESYALSVAPYWLSSAADDLDYETYASGRSALLRSASLSLATTSHTDDVSGAQTTSLGLGLRVALAEGRIEQSDRYLAQVDSLRELMDLVVSELDAVIAEKLEGDERLMAFEAASDAAADGSPERRLAESLIEQREAELADEAEAVLRQGYADEIAALRSQAAGVPIRRTGLNVDLTLGSVMDFAGADFDQGDFRSGGAWLTASMEYPWGAGLAVGRIVKDWNDDVTSFDLGSRLIVDDLGGLSLSAEGLARVFPNVDSRDTEWRVAISADYSVGSNQLLSFTFGRDFEGQRTNDLIAAVSLSVGFGALRPGF